MAARDGHTGSMSRTRKHTKPSRSPAVREQQATHQPERPGGCRCAACREEENRVRQLGDQLLTSGRSLLRTDDPLDAEMAGTIFASVDEQTDGELLRAVVEKVLPRFARKPSRQAL